MMKEYKQVIVIRSDLKLSKGKLSAQAAHASLEAYKKADGRTRSAWESSGAKKVVVKVEDLKGLMEIYEEAMQARLPASIIRDAGHAPVETTVGIEAVDLPNTIVGGDHEGVLTVDEGLGNRFHRGDGPIADVPITIILIGPNGLWSVEITHKGDGVWSHAHEGGRTTLTGRAAGDALLVVTLPGALAPAQAPNFGATVASLVDRRLFPGVPGFIKRPALDFLWWL